jgi:polar amino acid transport system permease protein
MIDSFARALTQWPEFLIGFLNTIWLCAFSACVSLALAMLLAIPLMSRSMPIRAVTRLFVDTFRSVPFLLLAYMAYYCLPAVGVRLTSWTAALLTLIVYNTAYFAEILRGAWSHLPPQQEECGRAFGFTGIQLFARIVGPQIFIAAGPVLGNQTIQLIKDSAFLMVITVPELTFKANQVQSILFVPFETFIIAGCLYWVLCSVVEWMVGRLERVAETRRSR